MRSSKRSRESHQCCVVVCSDPTDMVVLVPDRWVVVGRKSFFACCNDLRYSRKQLELCYDAKLGLVRGQSDAANPSFLRRKQKEEEWVRLEGCFDLFHGDIIRLLEPGGVEVSICISGGRCVSYGRKNTSRRRCQFGRLCKKKDDDQHIKAFIHASDDSDSDSDVEALKKKKSGVEGVV